MVMAVLEARCGVVGANDVYLNVAGGLRIAEPAADLAVAAALLSSLSGTPVPRGTVVFGEVGLSGEVRAVAQTDARLKKPRSWAFVRHRAGAGARRPGAAGVGRDIERRELSRLSDLAAMFVDEATRPARGRRLSRGAGMDVSGINVADIAVAFVLVASGLLAFLRVHPRDAVDRRVGAVFVALSPFPDAPLRQGPDRRRSRGGSSCRRGDVRSRPRHPLNRQQAILGAVQASSPSAWTARSALPRFGSGRRAGLPGLSRHRLAD